MQINKYLKAEEPYNKAYTVTIEVRLYDKDWLPIALTRVDTVKLIKYLLYRTGQRRLTKLVR